MVSATVKLYPTFFLPKMQEFDLHEMWFLQNAATCHTARVSMHLVRGEFSEHFIACSRPVNWQPKTWDLTTLDYLSMSIQTSQLQLTHWKTTLNHLFVRYRLKCWQHFAWNNLQTLNYMHRSIDSNKDLMHFWISCVLSKNFPIALKKHPL